MLLVAVMNLHPNVACIVRMSSDELNVLRYAGGYVVHNLLKRYEKITGDIRSSALVRWL